MLRKILLLCGLALALTGCALPGTVSPPTPYPADYIPTVIFMTAQSINATISAGITPTETPIPTSTPIPPTPAPTNTPTPAPGIPLSVIQINAPGPMSKIVSPVELHADVTVEEAHKVEVALFGEDGEVISHPPLTVFSTGGSKTISLKLPFEIRAAGEVGIVQISIKDSRGQLEALNSVRVLLLSSGVSQINPAGNNIYEHVVFYDLPVDAHVSGGIVAARGRFAPVNDKPVILELVGEDGKSLGLRVLDFTGMDWQAFDTTIPYKVTEETSARLFIYQDDELIDGRAYIYSQPIDLSP